MYEPSLWYYNAMKFLDVLSEDSTQSEQDAQSGGTAAVYNGDTTNDTCYDDDVRFNYVIYVISTVHYSLILFSISLSISNLQKRDADIYVNH